jgi:hypothetical protein
MSDLRKFGKAVTESFAPLLRKTLHGDEITEDEARKRLKYQLQKRGFDIENKSNKTETDADTDTDTDTNTKTDTEQETDE